MKKGSIWAWVVAIICFIVLMMVTPAIPQSQEYHQFADQRRFFGIPNMLNVVSNFPFLGVGVIGLILCYHGDYFQLSLQGELWGWTCFFIGVAAVAFGSSYYHLKPDDTRLVWDRLPVIIHAPNFKFFLNFLRFRIFWIKMVPLFDAVRRKLMLMTIAFTSIIAIFIIERVDEKKGTISIIPLVMAGIISILYWRYFDDLRPYALVQFLPCIAIPLMAILMPPMYTHSSYWLWAAGFYLLAKVLEAEDKAVYGLTHAVVSGHTLKHLAAAMVPVFLTLMLAKRSVAPERQSLLTSWKISWTNYRESRIDVKSSTYTEIDVITSET